MDAFLAEPKTLDGPPPLWNGDGWYGFYSAVWNLKSALGSTVGAIEFRVEKADRSNVSMSVIYRSRPVWRVDLDTQRHGNPHDGWIQSLPAFIEAPQAHPWPLNRAHVLSQDRWEIPYARELPHNVRRLDQALLALAQDINVTIESDQRGFEGPRQKDLFS